MEANEQSFLRQRRNLVLTSALMLVFVVGDIELDKVNFIIGTAKIGDSRALLNFFALISLYFLHRYRAYCQKNVLYTFVSSVSQCYSNTNANYAANYTRVNLLKMYPDVVNANETLKLIYRDNDVGKLISRIEGVDEDDPRLINVSIAYPGADGKFSEDLRLYFKFPLNDAMSAKNYLKCFYQAITMNSFFSEYVLPYLLFWASLLLYINKIHT